MEGGGLQEFVIRRMTVKREESFSRQHVRVSDELRCVGGHAGIADPRDVGRHPVKRLMMIN